MAIRLHGSARTTPRICAELQLATGSHRSLTKLYGINPKTVAKWRVRTSVLDEPMGPLGRKPAGRLAVVDTVSTTRTSQIFRGAPSKRIQFRRLTLCPLDPGLALLSVLRADNLKAGRGRKPPQSTKVNTSNFLVRCY